MLYMIYERGQEPSAFTPVGYITVFKFCNPLGRKRSLTEPQTEQNETRRICQVLVFPTFQRQGHCEQLVHCISARALASDNVYEITVEDPVPAFAKVSTEASSVLRAPIDMAAGSFVIL